MPKIIKQIELQNIEGNFLPAPAAPSVQENKIQAWFIKT